MTQPQLLIIERAFPEAQRLLSGATVTHYGRVDVGWHDTAVSPWTGAAAVVRRGGPLMELIGQTLRVTSDDGSCLVYVVGGGDVLQDLSVARRAFLALSPLAEDELDCMVEIT